MLLAITFIVLPVQINCRHRANTACQAFLKWRLISRSSVDGMDLRPESGSTSPARRAAGKTAACFSTSEQNKSLSVFLISPRNRHVSGLSKRALRPNYPGPRGACLVRRSAPSTYFAHFLSRHRIPSAVTVETGLEIRAHGQPRVGSSFFPMCS